MCFGWLVTTSDCGCGDAAACLQLPGMNIASIVWLNPFGNAGRNVSSYTQFQLLQDPLNQGHGPDFTFRQESGQWTLQSTYDDDSKNATIMAYGGTAADIQPDYGTLHGGYWPHVAYLRGWWKPDGTVRTIGLFANPAEDGAGDSTYHGLLRASWNADGTLTLYDWGYQDQPGVPLSYNDLPPAVPESPALWPLVLLLVWALRRARCARSPRTPPSRSSSD